MEYLRASICRIVLRYEFHAMKVNFHRSYLGTDSGIHAVTFTGFGDPLMSDIPDHGIMYKLQRSYPENCDELV